MAAPVVMAPRAFKVVLADQELLAEQVAPEEQRELEALHTPEVSLVLTPASLKRHLMPRAMYHQQVEMQGLRVQAAQGELAEAFREARQPREAPAELEAPEAHPMPED